VELADGSDFREKKKATRRKRRDEDEDNLDDDDLDLVMENTGIDRPKQVLSSPTLPFCAVG